MPKPPDVPLDTWRRLYQAGLEFAALEPWTYMEDSSLFAVLNPEKQEAGYCAVLGALGDILALIVYRGSEGLRFHRLAQANRLDPEHEDLFALHDCLTAEFVQRSELKKPDREVLDGLGLDIRGHRACPQFRSYRPGHAAWYLDASEARFLTQALICASDFVQRYQEDPGVGEPDSKGAYLLYVPRHPGARAWETFRLKPAPVRKSRAKPPALDDLRLRRIKNLGLAPGGTWEASAFFVPAPIQDRDRPYFARASLVVETASGLILGTTMVPPEAETGGAVAELVLSCIEQHRRIPAELRVRDAAMRAALLPWASALGFEVRAARRLPAIAEARSVLFEYLARQ